MNEQMNTNEGDDQADLGALLRAAGPRARPGIDVEAQVRAAVQAEWRAALAARERRRRVTQWSVAAGIAVAAVGVWMARPLYTTSQAPVAALARAEGTVEYRTGHRGDWQDLPAHANLRTGDELRTGPEGRAAVRLASGVELRLDNATRVAFDDSHHARLRRGGVYVDSGVNGADTARDLELDTPEGTVRHLGTQYEVRVGDGTLRIAVREGLVAVDQRGGDVVGKAGEQLTLQGGQVSRIAVAPNSSAWAWVGSITPPFAIEGRSVDEFLAWAGRETGRQVVYASPQAAERARAILLKGSVSGLEPDAAVTAVLSTTTLRPELQGGRIRVDTAGP